MSTGTKVGGFVVALVVLFGAAFGIGKLFEDEPTRYTLAATYEPGMLTLQIADQDGLVREYETRHEKKLHLIAVRTDFTGYQHLHPRLGSDGSWSVDADLPPGPWRLYADYQRRGGSPTVSVADLTVAGEYAPHRPTEQSSVVTVDGFRVEVTGALTAGASSALSFFVKRSGGSGVSPEPYLGARGHLVVLRERDLAYQHAHPASDRARVGPVDLVTFGVEVPTAGRYHLYFDFKVDGTVHTATFLVEAAAASNAGVGDHGGMDHGDH